MRSQPDTVFAPCYFEKACREYEEVTAQQRTHLKQVHDLEWGDAEKIAMLHEIDVLLKQAGIQRKGLSQFFPHLDTSSFTKWFNEGRISSSHFSKLLTLPMIAGKVILSPRDIAFHGRRQANAWVRREVLSDPKCKNPIKFDEFMFLRHLHRIDEEDIRVAFTKLPEKLLRLYENKDDSWLNSIEWDWGKSYRLLELEMNHEL
ncbi:MAG: hypothetical protein QM501_10170 [Gimesia sp.]